MELAFVALPVLVIIGVAVVLIRRRSVKSTESADGSTGPSVGDWDIGLEPMEQARKLTAAGEYREALAVYSCILSEFPNHAPALYERGYCYTCVGDYHCADDDFRQGFELDPDYVNGRGTVMRHRMLKARDQVDPKEESNCVSIDELVDQKFRAEVRPEVLRVLHTIEDYRIFPVQVEQLQRALIELSDTDGCFITELQFRKCDSRDLVAIADSLSLEKLEGPGFADLYRARMNK
jgi:tetratricopeptide (TPR) repeat protein